MDGWREGEIFFQPIYLSPLRRLWELLNAPCWRNRWRQKIFIFFAKKRWNFVQFVDEQLRFHFIQIFQTPVEFEMAYSVSKLPTPRVS